MNDTPTTPGPGHNQPPELLADRTNLIALETITSGLNKAYELDMKKAMDRRVGALKINDVTDENAVQVQDFIAQIKASRDLLDDLRDKQRTPFRKAADQVQSFFKPEIDALEKEQRRLARMLGVYDDERRRKEEAQRNKERREAEAERLRLQKIEDDKRAEAAKLAEDGKREEAAAALAAAETAQTGQKAAGKVARRTLKVGGLGSASSSSSVRKKTTFEIADMDKLDPGVLWGYLDRDDIVRAIQNYVDDQEAEKQPLELAGVTFSQDITSTVRGKK